MFVRKLFPSKEARRLGRRLRRSRAAARDSKAGKTGRLEVSSADVDRKIFFDDGRIVFASSSSPDDRLGAYLLLRNELGLADLRRLSPNVRPGLRLGSLLVNEGILSAEGLPDAVLGQVRGIVLDLRWPRLLSFRGEAPRRTRRSPSRSAGAVDPGRNRGRRSWLRWPVASAPRRSLRERRRSKRVPHHRSRYGKSGASRCSAPRSLEEICASWSSRHRHLPQAGVSPARLVAADRRSDERSTRHRGPGNDLKDESRRR
jgi:hypothetical protein